MLVLPRIGGFVRSYRGGIGAKFCLAPGINPEIVAAATEIDMPFVPGIATPSDVECGLSMGCKTLKFFPAGMLGGPKMIANLAGPYGHTGVKFVPTGGVNAENIRRCVEYLRETNWSGVLSIECFGSDENIRKSVEFLRGILGQ